MRTLLLAVLLATLVAAAPAAAAPKNVIVDDDWFVRAGDPPTIKVKKGRTVEWEWVGSRDHNVVTTSGPTSFQSALKRSGTFKRKLRKVGTYRIVCSIHAPDMAMKIKVRRR
jgi:plastocyanin